MASPNPVSTPARVAAKVAISLGLIGGVVMMAIGWFGQARSAVAAYGELGECRWNCDHAVAPPSQLTWADIVFYIGAIGGAVAAAPGTPQGWSGVATGARHTCAIAYTQTGHADGPLYCWGENRYGEVGDGTRFRETPVSVAIRKFSPGKWWSSGVALTRLAASSGLLTHLGPL